MPGTVLSHIHVIKFFCEIAVLIYYEVVVIDFNLLPVKMNIINDNVGIFNINIIKAKSLKDSTFLEIVTVAISLSSFDML